MNKHSISPDNLSAPWSEMIVYPQSGANRQSIFEDANCKYALVSIVANASIDTHTSPRNATVNVIEGTGLLTIESREILLEPGVFALIPARAPHAVKASTNLSFLLTLSA